MASRKRTPDTSKLIRSKTIAYARKQKTGDAADDDDDDDDAPAPDSKPSKLDQKFDKTELSQPIPPMVSTEEPTRITETVPATKPPEAQPVDERARVATVTMPPSSDIGAPPDMPTVIVPATSSAGAAEDPTNMPEPSQVPGGSPDDPAAPPGVVPPGDSRSLRRRGGDRYEFALIYRQTTFVISRTGAVGTRGVWRVVEYPTSAAAGTAYAKECSRFVSEGFTDYRG